MTHVYLNGRVVPEAEALVPVNDRAILFGDGAYETMRSYSGKFFRFPEHLARLRYTLAGMDLELPTSNAEIIAGAEELIRTNETPNARVRLTVTGGSSDGRIRLERAHPPNLIMASSALIPPPPEAYRDGVVVLVSPWRVHTDSPLPRIKTVNRLMHLMAKEEALKKNAWDTLFLDEGEVVLEGTATNVFFVVDGVLRTSPLESPLLAGVTRDLVLEEARAEGIPVREEIVPLTEALSADEAFLTSTTIELLPIRALDDDRIGNGKPGPVWRALHARYRATVGSELGLRLDPIDA